MAAHLQQMVGNGQDNPQQQFQQQQQQQQRMVALGGGSGGLQDPEKNILSEKNIQRYILNSLIANRGHINYGWRTTLPFVERLRVVQQIHISFLYLALYDPTVDRPQLLDYCIKLESEIFNLSTKKVIYTTRILAKFQEIHAKYQSQKQEALAQKLVPDPPTTSSHEPRPFKAKQDPPALNILGPALPKATMQRSRKNLLDDQDDMSSSHRRNPLKRKRAQPRQQESRKCLFTISEDYTDERKVMKKRVEAAMRTNAISSKTPRRKPGSDLGRKAAPGYAVCFQQS